MDTGQRVLQTVRHLRWSKRWKDQRVYETLQHREGALLLLVLQQYNCFSFYVAFVVLWSYISVLFTCFSAPSRGGLHSFILLRRSIISKDSYPLAVSCKCDVITALIGWQVHSPKPFTCDYPECEWCQSQWTGKKCKPEWPFAKTHPL